MKTPPQIALSSRRIKVKRRQANFYLATEVLALFRSLIPKGDQSDLVGKVLESILHRKQLKQVLNQHASRQTGRVLRSRELTTKTILIDKDIIIAFLKGNMKANRLLDTLSDTYDIACSVVTIQEIYAEIKKTSQSAADLLLKGMITFSVDEEIAKVAGQYFQNFSKQHLSYYTCSVAATAKIYNLRIATASKKRYPMKDIALDVVKL